MLGSRLRVWLILLLFIGPAVSGQAEVSLAYVDAARLLREAPQAQQIRQRIREEFKARDQRLVEMRKQIDLLDAQLHETEGSAPDSEQLHRLKSDLEARRQEYKRARDELDQDKQLRFSEEEERLTRIIHEVIQQAAQDERLDLVLQGGVIWVAPRVDITERILARLQKMLEQGN